MTGGKSPDVGRRRFMAASAAAGVAAGLEASQAVAARQLESWLSIQGVAVLLHDARFARPSGLPSNLLQGMRTFALTGDPVWFWRSEGATVLRDPSTTLVGVSGWADLLVFRGLAAETHRRLRHENFDSVTGAFTWLIR